MLALRAVLGLPKPDLQTPFKPPQALERPDAKNKFVDNGNDSLELPS